VRKFSEVAGEPDYAVRVSAETPQVGNAPKDVGSANPPGRTPGTDGPRLVDLMRMSEDEWDAYTRGSAMRRGGGTRGSGATWPSLWGTGSPTRMRPMPMPSPSW
jgi:hypothetical protein